MSDWSKNRMSDLIVVVAIVMTYSYFIIRTKRRFLKPSSRRPQPNTTLMLDCDKFPLSRAIFDDQKEFPFAYEVEELPFKSQSPRNETNCPKEGSDQESRTPQIDSAVRAIYTTLIISYSSLTLKYGVLCLLDFELFSNYRWLDCYLLGRFAFTGRVTRSAKYVALLACAYILTWCFFMLVVKPPYKHQWVEFLLQERDYVEHNEAKSKVNYQVATCAEINNGMLIENKRKIIVTQDNEEFDSITYTRNPFFHGFCEFIFKPNRTVESWLRMKSISISYVQYMLGLVVLLSFVLVPSIVTVLITNQGFELNHIHCINWIVVQEDREDYAFIYSIEQQNTYLRKLNESKPQRVTVYLPLDLKPITFYNIVIASFDALDNFIVYTGIINSLVFSSYLILMMTWDLILYSRALAIRLKLLIELIAIDMGGKSEQRGTGVISLETCELQALLVDYFNLNKEYSSFTSAYGIYYIVLWYTYSGVVIFKAIKSSSGKTNEWYIVQLGFTVMLALVLGLGGYLRHTSGTMYALVARMMALDRNELETKQRWATILHYYFPKPLHCFTVFSAELSWLLGLKLILWPLTASLVLASYSDTLDFHK